MTRNLNKESIALIKQWEGIELTAYPDPGSSNGHPWTIGYGHTSDDFFKVYKGLTISEAKAEELLVHDLKEATEAVDKYVTVELSDNQYGALSSFVHNIGVGAFSKSTLVRELNKGNYARVPSELAKWINNDGKPMKGLVNRRAAEAGLWAKGEFVSSSNVAVGPTVPALVTKESVSWGAGIASTVAAAFSNGMGPVPWVFAFIMVVAFGVGLYLFFDSRKAK